MSVDSRSSPIGWIWLESFHALGSKGSFTIIGYWGRRGQQSGDGGDGRDEGDRADGVMG